jgi:hypothetical protein
MTPAVNCHRTGSDECRCRGGKYVTHHYPYTPALSALAERRNRNQKDDIKVEAIGPHQVVTE